MNMWLFHFLIQIIFRLEHFILLIMYLRVGVINLTGYVHFRNKNMSTNPNNLLLIHSDWPNANDLLQFYTKGGQS